MISVRDIIICRHYEHHCSYDCSKECHRLKLAIRANADDTKATSIYRYFYLLSYSWPGLI